MTRLPGRGVLGPAFAAVALLVTAGCSDSGVYATTQIPTATPAAPATSGPAPAKPSCGNPLASYQPDGPNPKAGRTMPAGSLMAKIQARGRLIAGVSADSMKLGARNPLTGQIEGFDTDKLKAVSKAIFNDPDKIEFKVITPAERIPALIAGSVDIVGRSLTINCARWAQIDFSTQYYQAGAKIMVPKGSSVTSLADLKGKKVCAPKGSTTMDKLKMFTTVIAVGSDTHTGCLILFQQGKVDGILGDDTVLAGLAAQDPYASVVKADAITSEPYGLGIAKKHPEFVKFVNNVLEDMRSNGDWTASYNTWFRDALGPAPEPPKAVYGRPES